jgi:hypothetical protein
MYPDGVVQLYIDTGSIMCTHYIWGRMRQMGVELFTAHMLSLQQYSIRAGGGIPGAGIGPVQSKSVSKVSVSYDTALGAIEGGGPWNLTIYGSQFLWFVNLVGTGGFEVLGFGYQSQLEGVVWTWQRGVQLRFGS